MNKHTRIFTGTVTSTKMNGVATVEVSRQKTHPLYKKSIKRTKKYHVRNTISAKESDIVTFVETRPISRTVKWQTRSIVNQKSKAEKMIPKTTKITKSKKKSKSSRS